MLIQPKNAKIICDKLVTFLHQQMKNRHFKKAVMGLSGGIDSAVVACLAQMALKIPKLKSYEIAVNELEQARDLPLLCVLMPSTHSSQESIADAKEFLDVFGLPFVILPLLHFENALTILHADCKQNVARFGNACARFRMTLLFDIAFAHNRIVLGTSNKSERMLGYGTVYGDLAAGINPLGNIYKTDVFALAEYLRIPRSICVKPPSADLFAGQSDEQDLGYSYDVLDSILFDFIERHHSKEQLLERHRRDAVEVVLQRYEKSAFKRELVPIADI